MTQSYPRFDGLVHSLSKGSILADVAIAGLSHSHLLNIEAAAVIVAAAGRHVTDVVKCKDGYIIYFDVMWPVYGNGDLALHLFDPTGPFYRIKLVNDAGWFVERTGTGELSSILLCIFQMARHAESLLAQVGYNWAGDL